MSRNRALAKKMPAGAVWRNRRALGAVEFAMTAPLLILVYLGGFQLMDAISAYRKVTITTRTVADLTSRSGAVTTSDLNTFMGAAKEVMIPYAASNATVRLTQIQIDGNGNPLVSWSVASAGPKLTDADLSGSKPAIAVPTSIEVPNTYLIFSEVYYSYVPVAGGRLIGPLTFSDSIFMNPRISQEITCADCTA